MRRSRLLYIAVVRPTITYGAQVWSRTETGKGAATALLQPLVLVQNKCLRKIAGAYKRTPIAALEREIAVLLLSLYINTLLKERALMISNYPAQTRTQEALNEIWTSTARGTRRRAAAPRPQASQELTL